MYYLVPPPDYYDYGGGGGGSEQWEDDFKPAEVNHGIVEFALSQFSGIDGHCYNVEVENFQRLVVGLEYKFDIVLKTKGNYYKVQEICDKVAEDLVPPCLTEDELLFADFDLRSDDIFQINVCSK